jgi:hypothetical protein
MAMSMTTLAMILSAVTMTTGGKQSNWKSRAAVEGNSNLLSLAPLLWLVPSETCW